MDRIEGLISREDFVLQIGQAIIEFANNLDSVLGLIDVAKDTHTKELNPSSILNAILDRVGDKDFDGDAVRLALKIRGMSLLSMPGVLAEDEELEIPEDVKELFDFVRDSESARFVSKRPLSSEEKAAFDFVYRSLDEHRASVSRKTSTIYRGALLHLWSSAEWFLRSILKSYALLRPNQLLRSKSAVPIREVIGYCSSREEMIEHLVERELDELFRENLAEWLEKAQAWNPKFAQDIPDEVQEVIQRRHVLIHHAGLISKTYRRESPFGKTRQLGERLIITEEYLRQALQSIEVTFLRYAIWITQAERKANQDVIPMTVLVRGLHLFGSKDFERARRVLEMGLSFKTLEFYKVLCQLHLAYCVSRLDDKDIVCPEVPPDSGDKAECYQAALRGDLDYFKANLERLLKQKVITRSEIRESAIFDKIRDLDPVKDIVGQGRPRKDFMPSDEEKTELLTRFKKAREASQPKAES